jgi:hypothetical protein
MTQQVINIGSAPDDATGDPLRTSFDKTNENFTELYSKGATEGLWNYNKSSTDTTTAPVSGRFKTNSGDYRGATQIAINAITIQGIDRSSTLRTLLVGDLVQCQDSTNAAAWCRYSLQSLPVDHGTWFQLNVTYQTDGGVASGDNQEIVFVFTASSGGGGGNVSNVGIPTNGQIAQWTDATHIQGIATSTLGFAPLASPTFTGDPKAPTPTAGDNDTSIATTAFVAAAVAAGSAGAPVGAEYITSTANATLTAERVLTDTATVTWDRATAGQIKANAAGGGSITAPTRTVLTSGTGTYTTPTGATWLEVELVGGGGAGGSGTVGTDGGNTTFGPITCTGGGVGPAAGSPAVNGGTASGGDVNLKGADGDANTAGGVPGQAHATGGMGGVSPFGGAGRGVYDGNPPGDASPNTGSGGGGGGVNAAAGVAGMQGGGAGGYARKLIASPAATYSYAVGAAGVAGSAFGSTYAGGNGGSGIIIVTAHFGG